MIKFQSSKQSEYTKSANLIKVEAKNVKLMSDKEDIATETDNNNLQSRKHEEELNIRIKDSGQKYQSSSANKQSHQMTRQSIPRRQPSFRYQNVRDVKYRLDYSQ